MRTPCAEELPTPASYTQVIAETGSGLCSSPDRSLAEGVERYFRDVYDHLIRISDLIDSYRDLLDERDGRLPLDGLESPQRREAAGGDCDDLL